MQLLLELLSWCPGAVGLLLRQKMYPRFLRQCGRNVLFGRFVKIQGANKISIGDGVVVNNYVLLDARNYPGPGVGITLEDNVFVGAGTEMLSLGEEILIKHDTNLGSECRILSDKKTVIEDNVLLAAYCRIGGTEHDRQKRKEGFKEEIYPLEDEMTKIGAGCWLGVRTSFRSGVEIGGGTIIGAHGNVEGSLPSEVVAVGNPAKILYSRT